MRRVELHNAFVWTCDECGRDNFERSVTMDEELASETVTQARREEIREILADMNEDMQHGEVGGHFCMRPETVECQHCMSEFEVEDDD